MMQGEIKTKIKVLKKASLFYLQLNLATLFLPIKILIFLLLFRVIKLLSDPLSECIFRRKLLVRLYSFLISSVHYKLCFCPSYHGVVEFTNMNHNV